MLYEEKKEFFLAYDAINSLDYPIHLHHYIELVHVIDGEVQMQVGNQKYLISSGQFAIIFPNVFHSYHTISKETGTFFKIINSYLDLLPPFFKNKFLNYSVNNPVLDREFIHEDVLYAEERLMNITYNENTAPLISALLSLLLAHIFPQLQLHPYNERPPQDITEQIIAYISNHYMEDLSLSSIANTFGIGKYALSRIFSNVLGVKFFQYLNFLRIDYAEQLLINTDQRIIDIAINCGYQNQQTFNRVFKERRHCTPKEYRDKYTKPFMSPNN
jgi:AraC-type DNA-binding domain-containing proteins